jgi:hypothetical protein
MDVFISTVYLCIYVVYIVGLRNRVKIEVKERYNGSSALSSKKIITAAM